ncbi:MULTISPECIES: aminoglycoside adenylyltransferase family protein [unclassified Pseudomonas]|uniref:aminoglycoside adenylyltransferase family protein n=1 Tax=unclassified Pseudomonas TaxID=196821 RepID=UPI002449A467|nr:MULTISPECIES: aminoglycoside adenylyltransferase family protein [unclassified Pseudomonas]MDH0303074.1 aminoglycoside adenylyltransferase family protein [Pseudomonas sp. GD04091]MDH1987662.1 aminoglycoside adenylyltransferase family protein [Pseudomonas sp. GD03689]
MPSIDPQLRAAQQLLARLLGDQLQAIHLYGSAVAGGLKPESDLDLLVTVAQPLDGATRRTLMLDLLAISAPPGTRPDRRALEVTVLVHADIHPWRYPARRELQFGEWLREPLLAGDFEAPLLDPDLAILLTKARQHSISLLGPAAAECFEPIPRADLAQAFHDTLAQWNGPEDWTGDERTVVLALARIWYSLATGEIAAKSIAAEWLLQRLPEIHRPVLANARDAYLGKAAERLGEWPGQVADFIHYCKTHMPA